MCKSVPQIEAARTRTSTSFGPILGMETASSCAPRSGRIFRKAFIVAVGIRKPCDEPVEPSGGRGRKSDVNTRHTTPEAATKPGDAQARFRYNRPRLGSSPNRVRPIRGNTQESPCLFERRSEEHTSELQSPFNLVCRLLLEKKNTHIQRHALRDEQT